MTPVGERLHELVAEIYPIARSLTGDGVRETLRILGERIDIDRLSLLLDPVEEEGT